MIDTIFYFAKTDDEYQAKLASGEISDKTIAFVEDVNKIYINGHDYIDRQNLEGWQADIVNRIRNVADQMSQDNDNMMVTLSQQLREAISDLETSIQEARTSASQTSAELTQFKSTIREETNTSIETAIHNAVTNSNGQNVWTEINKANDGVSAVTTRLNRCTDSQGNIRYTSAIQSVVDASIDNNQAIADIAQRYAVLDENQEVIEWLSSGFKSKTGDSDSFAAMYAAAESATQSAIAQAKTEVLRDVDNNYVSTTKLGSQVINTINNNLSTSLSDIALKSDVNQASATMQASYTTQQQQIDGINDDITSLTNSIAQVNVKADQNRARAELLTSLNDNGAAVINESAFDSALSRIIAKSGQAASAITAIANEQAGIAQADMTTQMDNALSSVATKTELGGAETRILNYISDANGNPIRSADIAATVDDQSSQISAIARNVNNLTNAGFVAQADLDEAVAGLFAGSGTAEARIQAMVTSGINGQDFSMLELSADQIKLRGHTLADHIEATSGTIGQFNIDSTKLSATNNGNTINVSPSTISTYQGQVATNQINTDGTGMLAKGGISWDANGNLTLSQAFLESLFNALANGALHNNTYKGIDETFTIYHSLYSNSISSYYDNATDLYNEISLWNNSTAPESAYLGRTVDRRNTGAQSYPFNGTVQQKREYYFRYKDIIGTFTSGILTTKRYVDPATQIPMDEFPELKIDHSIYIVHMPTISEFAQANNLVANKFVGVTSRPTLKFTSQETTSSETSIFNTSGGLTLTGFYDIAASNVSDISNLANPTEGTWAIAWQAYYSVDGGASGNGWLNEPHVFQGISSPIASTDYSVKGFVLKYTNNAWTILQNQTALQTTCIQYRGNETE